MGRTLLKSRMSDQPFIFGPIKLQHHHLVPIQEQHQECSYHVSVHPNPAVTNIVNNFSRELFRYIQSGETSSDQQGEGDQRDPCKHHSGQN